LSSAGALLVLFDADCGFCARCAMVLQRLDRHHRLAFLPLQDAASLLTEAPSREELAMTLHVRDLDGRWVRGGAAYMRIAAALPVLTPLALAGRLLFASTVIERGYQLVARNRHRLSRLLGLDGCRFEPIQAIRA
jgi:predicted DCC family thiol-disulfide oxidoreductase YuxK